MRFRLFHTLSLTLLAFTAAAVLSLGGLTAWHLQNGFGAYLAARDVQHFERFVGVVEARASQNDGLDNLLAGQLDLRDLLNEINPGPPGPPGPLGSSGQPGRSQPPPHEHNSAAFPERIQVRALNGTLLLGSPSIDRPGSGPMIERPVHAKDQMVAWARMRPDPIVRTGAEARFLHDQYALIAAGALGLIVLALLTATRLARRWTKPLAAVQEATRRLAQGELTLRLPVEPHLAGRSDEIGDVMRNVNRMAEGLQKLEAARRRWLADISHELRTPLTVLRGDIEALNEGIRPLRPEAIEVLHEEVQRLNRLVDDLHLLAITDLQALPCHMAADDAVAMLQRLQARYESRARTAGLSLRVQWPAYLAMLNVYWDTGRMEQLMANLLENSLRYTHAPGQVLVRLELDDHRIRLVVEDSAPGVSEGQLPQLFEPLYRGDAARDNRSGGSGLGLAICQVIAEAHGGQLTASASGLGGLALTLELPRTSDVLHAALTGSAT